MASLIHEILHGPSKHVQNWTLIPLLLQLKQYRLDRTAPRKRWEGIVWRGTSQTLGIGEFWTQAEDRKEFRLLLKKARALKERKRHRFNGGHGSHI
jgi:hypothetical protein